MVRNGTFPATNLNVRISGQQGPDVLLLHGSTGNDGEIVWSDQRQLSADYRMIVPDRRGYGGSPDPAPTEWEDHIRDVVALLGEGAHFVGHSYGAVLGLVVGSRRPELIRSLTLIEPPAFGLARGDPAVEKLLSKLMPAFSPSSGMTPEEFSIAFGEALTGQPSPLPTGMSHKQREQTLNIMREPVPWEAPVELDKLAVAPFRKLVVSGNWHPAFEAVCDVLTDRLSAERLVLAGNGHGPHHVDGGRPLNARLLSLFQVTKGEEHDR